ncbi:MAG: hypothetical protein ACO1N1_22205 [Dyadobacter fermentans]
MTIEMKYTRLFLFAFHLCWSFAAEAQQFSPTTGIPCNDCQPTDYSAVHTPSISDIWNPSGSQVDKWNIQGPRLPDPPSDYSVGLPAGAGQYSFVTLKTSEGNYDDRLFINVSGFTVGQTYQFRYAVLSASVHYEAGNNSPYGQSGTMQVLTVGPNAVEIASQTTNFDNWTRNQWIKRVVTFKATSTVHQFKLTGSTAGLSAGYINFCIDKYPFDCLLLPNQVSLNTLSPINTLFPSDKLNLNTIAINGTLPISSELVWKTGPNTTDQTLTTQEASSVPVSNLDPANMKPYYAFFYAKDFNCYNVPISQAELKFMHVPTQVPLKQSNVIISCPALTTDLTQLEDSPVAQVRWFKDDKHTIPVLNPKAALPGDYFAFYYNFQSGDWSLLANQDGSSKVHVEHDTQFGIPDLGPTLLINSLIFPPNGSKDFVVKMQNIKAENSNCLVHFKVAKLAGFTISYSVQGGQSNVKNGMDNSIANNNDFWSFSEDNNYITVSSKNGLVANGYSYIGFKIARNGNTAAGSKKNLSISIPPGGGGGETNTTNNQVLTTVITN